MNKYSYSTNDILFFTPNSGSSKVCIIESPYAPLESSKHIAKLNRTLVSNTPLLFEQSNSLEFDKSIFQYYGTGTLIFYKNYPYFITAYHCFESVISDKKFKYYLPSFAGYPNVFSYDVPIKKIQINKLKLADIILIPLTSQTYKSISKNYYFYSEKSFDLDTCDKSLYEVFGYPIKKNKVIYSSDNSDLKPPTITCIHCFKNNIQDEKYFYLDFNRKNATKRISKNNTSKEACPKLNGLSGAGVYKININKQPKLSGILIEHSDNKNQMKVVKLSFILKHLKNNHQKIINTIPIPLRYKEYMTI